jgi:hypothetical protein
MVSLCGTVRTQAMRENFRRESIRYPIIAPRQSFGKCFRVMQRVVFFLVGQAFLPASW